MHQSHLIAEYLYLEKLANNMDIDIVCCDAGFTLFHRKQGQGLTYFSSVREIRDYMLQYEHPGNYLRPHYQKQAEPAQTGNKTTE